MTKLTPEQSEEARHLAMWVIGELTHKADNRTLEIQQAQLLASAYLDSIDRDSVVVPEEESAWLIEAFINDMTMWWRSGDSFSNYGEPNWTRDAFKAVRFTRCDDAQTIIETWPSWIAEHSKPTSHLFMLTVAPQLPREGVVVPREQAAELRRALSEAAYALFQIKRMVGVTDLIKEHAIAAHQKACSILNNEIAAPQEGGKGKGER